MSTPGPGPSSTAQVLMRKGKRGAGAYIHADCASGSPQHLAGLLDVLLHPNKAIDEWETIDWCRWLIAGGRTPDEFSAIVRCYDNHAKCGLVWIPHVVAYRCRTCGISPCMSICRECFRRGDHSTHDFNMFLSQAGGACDCGDTSVMKEDGFCSNHGINNCANKSPAPADLMCVAEAMMPRVILRLLQHFRENRGAESNSNTYRKAVQECEGYVSMLMEFNNMGELMRKAMTKALINPQMYRNMVEPPFPNTEYGLYLAKSMIMYEAALDSFPAPDPPPEYKHLPALSKRMSHTTLLEEFIFWTFKYEFPQNVVCFLLNMLPDQDYKEHLTRTFVMHYARIPLVLELSADPDMLSNRVVHMSVQLFSNEALALRCQQQLSLLHVMVISLKLMMNKILIKNTLHEEANNKHMVIDCARRVMKEHCYWPLVSDFNNVLSHKSVALVFLQDDTLIDMWFQFLSMLQGMNVNEREMGSHVEYEPSSYYAAFSCELEASAYPMWSIISHLTGPEHAPLARKIISCCLRYLKQWLQDINFTTPFIHRQTEVLRASFHFPLHRYLAAFICQAVRHMGCTYTELLPDTDTLFLLMIHPLRVQSLFYEILSSIWVRNGLQIKGQAMTYIQANFCNSMVDMDIYFLQVCAAHLPTHQFIDICINVFGVSKWLGLGVLSSASEQEQDAMVEGLLTLLGTLVSSHTNLSHTELTQSRLEVSTLLATSDKTHSQLLELMPERSGNAHTRNFETVLKELSYYRAPPKGSETLEQGQFAPKAVVWAKYYDPLHVLQRAVHRRDFQNSMDRFTQYVKSSGGANAKLGSLWPPLRRASNDAAAPGQCDPRRLAACGRVHALCMSVLHRAVHRKRPPPEHVLALAVYLLETAVDLEQAADPSTVCQYRSNTSGSSSGPRPLMEVFTGDSLTQNACVTVVAVAPPQSPPASQSQPQARVRHVQHNYPTAYNSDSDTEWDPVEGVEVRTINPPLPAPQPSGEERDHNIMDEEIVAAGRTELLVHHDYVMREDDDVSLQEEAYQLALPAPEPTQDMSVALPSNMTMVPTSHQGAEMYLGEDGEDIVSMELEVEEGEDEEDEDNGDDDDDEEDGEGSGSATGGQSEEVALPTLYNKPTSRGSTSTHHRSKRGKSHPGGVSSKLNLVLVNESIISLLLKLHSQLSGTLDSFSLDDDASAVGGSDSEKNKENTNTSGSSEDPASSSKETEAMDQGCGEELGDSRIGDGPHFIGQLLRKLCAAEPACAQAIENVRATLWPRQRERQAEQRAREQREREERTRRARERQRTLMQDFMSKQKEFMRRAMEEGGEGEEWLCDEEEQCRLEREYDCIICNTTSPSTENNPIGLVVLLQSSSVVGHRRSEKERASLPLSDLERNKQKPARDFTLAAHHFRRQHDMDQHFDSWLVSVNVGWEGGVHVQTCGHHVHLACLRAYLRSLVNSQRPHSLHTDRGEFLCPVCRQLANSVLPLSPGLGGVGAPARCVAPSQETLLSDIQSFLKYHQRTQTSSNLSEAMGKAMEDMTNCTALRFKQRGAPGPQALFLFVASVARTNLEAELVQRGGTLASPPPRYKPRPDCLVPLLDVLAVHARVLCQWPAYSWWEELTAGESSGGSIDEEGGACGGDQQLVPGTSLSDEDSSSKQLPLLLKDPLALLIHFLLLAPLHLEMPYLTCMIHALYNLTWVQCVIQALLSMSPAQLEVPLPSMVAHLLTLLQSSALFHQEDQPQPSASELSNLQTEITDPTTHWRNLDKQIQQQVLPYLRVCALLRYHLGGQELPSIPDPQYEFHYLFKFLEFVPQDMSMDNMDTSSGLKWFSNSERLTSGWVRQLLGASSRCPLLTRRLLLPQHHHWEQPALLRLPREYDRLFTYYHERICSGCGAVPKEASVCLVCGTVVCLKQSCCRQQEVCEAVQHSVDCGGGTGVFLVVTSTYIIIVRGRRACLWGSLYLDDYDEEDRDLKRGKPLYLSEDRFELLEQQWLAHRFDHTKRTWVWHRDSL